MAAGLVTDDNYGSVLADSNACADVLSAVNGLSAAYGVAFLTCTSDPVVVGTVLEDGVGFSYSIRSIAATSSVVRPAAQSINCVGSCTVTLVHDFNVPVLSMSLSEVGQIGLAIVACWAVAWVFRLLVRMLRDDGAVDLD